MYPFRSVLVPSDFTGHARAALKYAAALAREGGWRVVLCRALDGGVTASVLTLRGRAC